MTADRIKRDLAGILARIPPGRVLVIGALSRHLRVSERAIETQLKSLNGGERANTPWHRVVMDGGALGQFGPRAEHMARLKAEGLAVAPAGIVQDMARVAIRDVGDLPSIAQDPSPPPVAAPAAPNRSRGRLGAPKSSV